MGNLSSYSTVFAHSSHSSFFEESLLEVGIWVIERGAGIVGGAGSERRVGGAGSEGRVGGAGSGGWVGGAGSEGRVGGAGS